MNMSYLDPHEGDENAGSQSVPSRIRKKIAIKGKIFSLDVLCFQASIKPDVGYTDPDPAHKTSNGGHIREPGKNFPCARRYSHERQQGEKRVADDGDIRQTRAGCFEEDFWCVTR